MFTELSPVVGEDRVNVSQHEFTLMYRSSNNFAQYYYISQPQSQPLSGNTALYLQILHSEKYLITRASCSLRTSICVGMCQLGRARSLQLRRNLHKRHMHRRTRCSAWVARRRRGSCCICAGKYQRGRGYSRQQQRSRRSLCKLSRTGAARWRGLLGLWIR